MIELTGTLLVAASLVLSAQPAGGRLSLLDVPFISQSEALCGGAAAAMVLRYWGQSGISADDFAAIVDAEAGGIHTADLARAVDARGLQTMAAAGTSALAKEEIDAGRPVIALIEDRPGIFHYVVIVGWHERGVVVHDPARTPYVVMRPEEFARRWAVGGNWMLAVSPTDSRPRPSTPALESEADLALPSCERRVGDGVRAAQAGDLRGAERMLADAAYRCPGAAPLRELAGVRLLQRRWPEVRDLAGRAVDLDPGDTHAWQLLATARYVGGDSAEALEAWNRAGEPVVDLVSVSGLQRTRHRTVEGLLDVRVGEVLTAEDVGRAARRLEELPAAMASRVEYVPRGNGRAEVRAHVAERPIVPSGRLTWVVMGAQAAASRELVVGLNGLAGAGERLAARYRFWPHRQAYGFALATPVSSAGVLGLEGMSEHQPFTAPDLPDADRAMARARLANWATGNLRWEGRGGIDRWSGIGTFGVIGAGLRWSWEAVTFSAGVDHWMGDERFSLADVSAAWATSADHRGTVLLARGGMQGAAAAVPLDLWPAGDTGHARSPLLRAHPLLDDGRIDVSRIGRSLAHAGAEVRRWWAGPGPLVVAPAAFLDAVRTAKRLSGPPITDLDGGFGVRVAIPGARGIFRLDAAHGFRDRRNAFSIAWEP